MDHGNFVAVMSESDFFDKFSEKYKLVPRKYKFIKSAYSENNNTIRIWASEMKFGVENLYFQIGLHSKKFKFVSKDRPGIYKLKSGYKYTEKGEDFIQVNFTKDNFYRVDVENTSKEAYKNDKDIDVIDFCEAYELDFALGNIVKCICKSVNKDKKEKLQDLLEAKEYLDRKIKSLE